MKEGSWVIEKTKHVLTAHEAVKAGCTEGGSSAYYSCDVCGRFFSDRDGKNEIEKDSWLLPAAGHNMKETPAKEPTCDKPGNKAYWACSNCKKYFADEEGTTEVQKEDQTIPAKGHTLKENAEKEATCTEEGNSAYWTCEVCGKNFSDQDGTAEAKKDSWVIPAKGHTLKETKEQEATCTEEGNSAYWTCEVCEKYFSDQDGKTEIEEDSWITEALGHDFVDGECTRCGMKDESESVPESSEDEGSEDPTEPPATDPAKPTEPPATDPAKPTETQPTQPPVTQPEDPSKPTETQPVPTISPIPSKPDETPAEDDTKYLVSLTDDGHGSATADPQLAQAGTTVTLYAEPDEGYFFKEWQVISGGVKISENQFIMGNDNVDIKAFFKKIPSKAPGIIEGEGSEWQAGSKQLLKIVCDGDFFSFTDLKVDGAVIAKKNYLVHAGSVIAELEPEYLETLDAGEHKVTFLFGDLESDTATFRITAKKSTGPSSTVKVILWIVVIAAALALISSILILIMGRKKDKEQKQMR